MLGLNWGIRVDNPSQHCTVGAMWAFYLLTGLNAQFEIRNSFRIGGGGIKEIDEIKHALMKEGVYWGRVCNGNKNGNSPVDNPSGCFHSFVMLMKDDTITIYQTMQGSWTMSNKYGIQSYTTKDFSKKIVKASTQTTYEILGKSIKKTAFTDLFWYRPTSSRHNDHHGIPTNGPPQVILNGPYHDTCELAPTLASFDFIPGRHNWGVRNMPPELLKVDWPVRKVHGAETMGHGGVAEGGWMKNAFCMCFEKAEEPRRSIFNELVNLFRWIFAFFSLGAKMRKFLI